MTEWDRRIAEFVDRASPEQRRVWDDVKHRHEASLARQLEWVEQLGALANEIVGSRADWRARELFWIRLFGVLDELGGGYAQQVAVVGDDRPAEGTLRWWLLMLHSCASSILKPLLESEVIVVDWLRQRAAHVRQRGYGLQLQRDKTTVKERRGIELLGNKAFTIDELDAARESVLSQHGDDEVAMQVALARKMLTPINGFVLVHAASLGR